MNELIAYCGLDCEKCDAYIATKNNDQALREKTAKLWSELNKAPISPELIACDGCRANGKKTVFCERMCAIRQCALKKGITTCGDCGESERCSKVAVIWNHNAEARRNLKRLLLMAVAVLLASSCTIDKTRYEIQYSFDNTVMRSDFLEVYELTPNGPNGKWRSNNHHVDTVVTNGDTVEWVSGRISDVAREDCIALQVFTSGYRPEGGGNYTLDTVYYLTLGEKNYFYINPGQTWSPTYGE